MRALLDNGPMEGNAVEVDPVEGRPPKTLDLRDATGSVYRYCLEQWKQEGHTAIYTFVFAL